MKRSVTSILDGCQPQELDGVLTNIGADLPEEASEERIRSLAVQKAGVPQQRPYRKILLIAACITLLAGILVGCYVAEQAEYDSAVKFFDLNSLDIEGLSRSDIKRVYRDITTESFAYDKSYELLSENRTTNTVEGMDISIKNSVNNAYLNTILDSESAVPTQGVYYDYNSDVGIEDDTEDEGDTYYHNAYIEKLIDGESAWRAEFKRPFYIRGYKVRDGRVLVWGDDMYDTWRDYIHTSVALVDDESGTILWEQTLDSRYHFDEYSLAALGDGGRIAILTVACDDRFADQYTLVFREMDSDGTLVTEHEQRMEQFAFMQLLTPLSDGWLAQLQYTVSADEIQDADSTQKAPALVKFGHDGEILSEWTLSENTAGGFDYEYADVIEHEGKIIVSALTRPMTTALYDDVDFDHITLDYENLSDGFSDEWLERARKEFSATLLILDPSSGKLEQFYTVDGAMPVSFTFDGGEDLTVDDDGNLVWHVGRIVRCGWAPWANSFQFYGITRQYDYTFDSADNLLKQEKTDRFASYHTM